MTTTFNVLFDSPNNASRPFIAKMLLNHHGKGRFQGFGVTNAEDQTVSPFAIEVLELKGISIGNPGNLSLADQKNEETKPLLVVMLFDPSTGEERPAWNGDQLTVDWHMADPLAKKFELEIESRRAFAMCFNQIDRRIALLVNLPLEKLDAFALQKHFDEINQPA